MAYPQSEYQVVTKLNVPAEYKSSGFVYVMENENMPGIYKIGMTTNSPEARAKELSSATGVPSQFSVLAAFHSQNPRVDEKLVHQVFSDHRVSDSREFFSFPTWADINGALSEIEIMVGPERNADAAVIAMNEAFISFSNESEIDLAEELCEQGIGGVVGNMSAVKNFLYRAGIDYVKGLISQHNASLAFLPGGEVVLVKSIEAQLFEKGEKE